MLCSSRPPPRPPLISCPISDQLRPPDHGLPRTTTPHSSSPPIPVMMTRSASALLLLGVLLAAGAAEGIRCYECAHNSQRMKRQQRYVYPCHEYDGGDLYVRDCPDSQLCVYQHISLRLASEAVVTVHTMDGCTPNSTSLGRYAEAGLVQAGCIQRLSRYRPPSSIYCYCDYDLCNGPLNAGAAAAASLPWQRVWLLLLLLALCRRLL